MYKETNSPYMYLTLELRMIPHRPIIALSFSPTGWNISRRKMACPLPQGAQIQILDGNWNRNTKAVGVKKTMEDK